MIGAHKHHQQVGHPPCGLSFVTPNERERMNELVAKIQRENHNKFTELVDESKSLIDQKNQRFPPKS